MLLISKCNEDVAEGEDNEEVAAIPTPLSSLPLPHLPSNHIPTILPSSLTYPSVSVDFTQDNVGLLAVYLLLLIINFKYTYYNGKLENSFQD